MRFLRFSLTAPAGEDDEFGLDCGEFSRDLRELPTQFANEGEKRK